MTAYIESVGIISLFLFIAVGYFAIHFICMQQGLQQGLRQGLQQGRNQRNREIAEKMLLKNKPIEEIKDFTELSEADVLAIKAALGKS